jgi:hypothetical protein
MGFDDDRINGIDNPIKTERSETIPKSCSSFDENTVGRSVNFHQPRGSRAVTTES